MEDVYAWIAAWRREQAEAQEVLEDHEDWMVPVGIELAETEAQDRRDMKTNIRKAAATVALALALVIPGSALAADSNGSTPESLDIAASISMTVPASVAYTQGKALNSTDVTVTGISTDNPTGLAVTLTVNDSGAGLITRSTRSLGAVSGGNGGWILEPAKASPFSDGGTERVDLATSTAPNASPVSITFASKVNASAYNPGSFTGSLNFRARTN